MISWLRRFADGLSSQAMEPQASPPKASIPRREETIVYLRSTRAPGAVWEDRVRYDVWGVPWVPGYGNRNGSWLYSDGSAVTTLRPDGTTDATWIYGTRWKHKSGPPVTFRKAPDDPFAEEPSQ